MTTQQRKIFDEFNARGWYGCYYPRLRMVSLNGFPRKPLIEGIDQMRRAIERKNERLSRNGITAAA
jgi:hypothetical protein